MLGPSTPLLVYAAVLAGALVLPYVAASGLLRDRDGMRGRLLAALVVGGAVVLTAARHGVFALRGAALLVPLLARGPAALLGGVAAILLLAPVIWWGPEAGGPSTDLGPVATCVLVVLGLVAASLPRLGAGGGPPPRLAVVFGSAAVAGLAWGSLSAPLGHPDTAYFAWHHWGAYLSPVEAWLAGARPYRDFPVQYGLGPTTLIAATCGGDCWRAMFSVAIALNALYFAVLATCAAILTAGASRGARWLALAAVACACFVWTGFPVHHAGPVMTPGTAGMRWLPLALLLLAVLWAEHRGAPRDLAGHAAWLLGLFWSPEAAFFATLVWWPYLALRDASGTGRPRDAWLALGRGALRGVGALALGAGAVLAVTEVASAGGVTLASWLTYLTHPPGPLLVNPIGAVWILVATLGLGADALARHGAAPRGRVVYACLLGLAGSVSYYLSRSHDNNVLNLFPFVALAVLAVLAGEAPTPTFTRGFGETMLAGMVALVATLNYGPWIDAAERGHLGDVGPEPLVSRFAPRRDDLPALLSPDAIAALEALRARDAGAVVLLDERAIMPWAPAGAGWTTMNNFANYRPLPEEMVQEFVRRGADAIGRPGWLVVEDGLAGWVPAYEAAYTITERERFGTYTAYHLVPR